MDYKYDAFISYRHAEKDTLIASEIQKSLERFNIPKALRKKTGKQRFNRVFRDVEELPISSNLTEDIEEALRASEYLIVICSFRTSESDWVKREIDTFLELHDYNKQLILTVLVEGEPDEVIPEILRHDNITHYLADGSFYCKDEVVEPLAADYRMPISKARKIELPRLAAAMLACNYDDIIRRRKAYKRTRLLIETAVISLVAIAVMIYIGYMFMKIQDGLRNTQVNQSRYLASESQKLLEDGDRVGAIQLALAALENTDGTRRPVTSEAEYALSSALGAYTTKGTTYSAPVWRYETASAISRYGCSSNSEHVAVLDTTGKLHIWDRKDHIEKVYESDSYRYLDFAFDKNNDLIIASTGDVALYDSKTMETKWKFNAEKVLVTRDRLFRYYSKAGYIVLNGDDTLYILNASDGSVVRKLSTKDYPVFSEKLTSKTKEFSLYDFSVNSDFTKIVLSGNINEYNNFAMYVYDVKTDKVTNLLIESGNILTTSVDNEGNILALRHSKEDPYANEYASRDELYDASVILEMYSPDGKPVWNTELSSVNRIVKSVLLSFEYTLKDGTKTPVAVAAFANRVVMVDRNTGTLIKSFDMIESVVDAYVSDQSLFVLIRSGMAHWIPLNEKNKVITSYKYFKDGILELSITTEEKSSSYFVKDSTNRAITEYSGRFSDSKFEGIEGSDSMNLIKNSIKCGDYLITFDRDGKINGVDLKARKVLWTVDMPKASLYSMDAFSPDKRFVFLIKTETKEKENECTLIKINCVNGQIAQANNEFSFPKYEAASLSGSSIWALTDPDDKDELVLYSYNMADDSVKKISVNTSSIGPGYVRDRLYVSPDGKKALVYYAKIVDGKNQDSRLTINTEDGTFTEAESKEGNGSVWNEKGTMFAESYKEGTIAIFSAKGEEKCSISTEMRIPRKMRFHEDKLYVVYNVGVLCSYDTKGNQLMSIDLEHGDVDLYDLIDLVFIKNNLYLTAGDYTDIISLSDARSICSLRGFLCLYNKSQDENDLLSAVLVCKTFIQGEGPMLGCFDYKTSNRLIEQAKEYLNSNGVKMSDDFKRRYGIT